MSNFEHVDLFFYPKDHIYKDEYGNVYTSVTQTIDKFIDHKDWKKIARFCEKAGRNPNHPKYELYKGKSANQILKEWDDIKVKGLDRGNERHDFIESKINISNNYSKIKSQLQHNRIYTIPDLLENPILGNVDLDFFIKSGIKDRYPRIYKILVNFVNKGYKIYAEVGVYNSNFLISGLVDCLLIKDNYFIIIDWKTNKGDIPKESGYYLKNIDGSLGEFVRTFEYFREPISHIEDSVRNHYTLQISSYDYLVEGFDLICKGNILCHITHDEYTIDNLEENEPEEWIGKERVVPMVIPYWKNDVELMMDAAKNRRKLKRQKSIIFK